MKSWQDKRHCVLAGEDALASDTAPHLSSGHYYEVHAQDSGHCTECQMGMRAQTSLGGFLFDFIDFGPKLVWVDFCLI